MDFAKAFAFVFEDQEWIQKIIIGGLLSLIPIVGWLLVFGYMVHVGRNVIRRNPRPLPEWSDLGQIFMDGLYAFLISLVYSLPILILMCIFLFPALALGGAFEANGDNLGFVGVLGICCFTAFAIIYGVAVQWFFLPASLARYADTGDPMSALRFNEILDITRANPLPFLMALIIAWIANSFIAPLGLVACIVGALFTFFYSQCVMGHAYGQAYLIASETAE